MQYLPSKVPGYLRRLHHQYDRDDENLQRDLIGAGRVFVIEDTSIDNLNGGTYGHDVQIFLSLEDLSNVEVSEQESLARGICEDLNRLSTSFANEFFRAVHLEQNDENDENFRRARSILSKSPLDPDSLSIWKPGMVRLFISHRDEYKTYANELAEALEPYGISSFVAHDTIEPMTKWQNEILKGLDTMEIMLAFVTDDFHESTWTNQEIGFALGRDIPVLSLKLQKRDPPGFIGSEQALRGSLHNPAASVPEIYELLAEKLGNRARLQSSLISAFLSSPSFSDTKERFNRVDRVVDSLSDTEVSQIIDGFEKNDQLHSSGHLTSRYQRLRSFLKRTTGREYIVEGKTVVAQVKEIEDEIPF